MLYVSKSALSCGALRSKVGEMVMGQAHGGGGRWLVRAVEIRMCFHARNGAFAHGSEILARCRRLGYPETAQKWRRTQATRTPCSYLSVPNLTCTIPPSLVLKTTNTDTNFKSSGTWRLDSRSFSAEPISHMQDKPAALRLRGLSYRATSQDIARFFEGYNLAGPPEEAVHLHRRMDGRPTGWASVFFESEQEARRAKQDKHRTYLHGRYIEIFVNFETGELEWIHQPTLSENVNRKHHGKDNR